MERTEGEASCCGGGGTGIWYALPGVNMNYTLAEQARDRNIDYVAVACPNCLQMLDDGMKSKDYEIAVKDIAQILSEAL